MSLRGDVVHSLKWLAGVRFAGQLFAWAITVVVIRILAPSDYGLMAIAGVMIGFTALFQEMGLYTAMVQKRNLTERQVEQAFGLLIITNSVIYIVVFLVAPFFATFFDDPRLTNIVRVLGIQFPLASVGVVQDAMLSRSMNFKRRSFAGLATTVGGGLTTLALALSGAGVWALVYGSLAGAVIRPIALAVAARHWCRPRFSREGMGELVRFGGFITTGKIIWYVYSQADVFIIGKLLGKEVLGFYSIAMQLATLPMQKVGGMLNQVGLAAYSTVQDNLDALRSHYLKAIRVLSVLAFPVFWGISSVAPELVPIVLGKRWERAIIPLQLLSFMAPVRMVSHSSSGLLAAIGKPDVSTLNLFISLVIMIPAFYFGTRYGGLVGVSLAWVVAFPIVRLIQLRISLPYVGLRIVDALRPMVGAASGGIVMYLAVVFTGWLIGERTANDVVKLVAMVATGVLVYGGYMWMLRRDDCREVLDLVTKTR